MKEREFWIDNLKGILIILVVIGHFIATIVKNNVTINILYNLINSIHMPCFMIISGYLSKSRIDRKDVIGILNRLAIPYFIAQFAIWCFACCFPGGLAILGKNYQTTSQLIWLKPNYHLWFIFALLIYNLVTMLISRRNLHFSIILSYILSIFVGYLPNIFYMRLSKLIAFYPFFLLGYSLEKKLIENIREKKLLKLIGLILILLWIGLFIIFNDNFYSNIFIMSKSYTKYPKSFGQFYPIISRVLFIPFASLISFSFIVLVSNVKKSYTDIGKNSLYPYILHGFFIIGLRATNNTFFPFFNKINSIPEYTVYIALAICLTYFLSSNFVVNKFKKIFEIELFKNNKSIQPPL